MRPIILFLTLFFTAFANATVDSEYTMVVLHMLYIEGDSTWDHEYVNENYAKAISRELDLSTDNIDETSLKMGLATDHFMKKHEKHEKHKKYSSGEKAPSVAPEFSYKEDFSSIFSEDIFSEDKVKIYILHERIRKIILERVREDVEHGLSSPEFIKNLLVMRDYTSSPDGYRVRQLRTIEDILGGMGLLGLWDDPRLMFTKNLHHKKKKENYRKYMYSHHSLSKEEMSNVAKDLASLNEDVEVARTIYNSIWEVSFQAYKDKQKQTEDKQKQTEQSGWLYWLSTWLSTLFSFSNPNYAAGN